MANWTFLEWVGVVAAVATIVAAVIAYLSFRKRGATTDNYAKGSKRVAQGGGEGATRNRAVDSEDVDQRG